MMHISTSRLVLEKKFSYNDFIYYIFRPIGVISIGSIPILIVGFIIVLTILRFISLKYVLLDSNANCKENLMEKTTATKRIRTKKMIGLISSSGIETVWAIGVAIISGQLMT